MRPLSSCVHASLPDGAGAPRNAHLDSRFHGFCTVGRLHPALVRAGHQRRRVLPRAGAPAGRQGRGGQGHPLFHRIRAQALRIHRRRDRISRLAPPARRIREVRRRQPLRGGRAGGPRPRLPRAAALEEGPDRVRWTRRQLRPRHRPLLPGVRGAAPGPRRQGGIRQAAVARRPGGAWLRRPHRRHRRRAGRRLERPPGEDPRPRRPASDHGSGAQ